MKNGFAHYVTLWEPGRPVQYWHAGRGASMFLPDRSGARVYDSARGAAIAAGKLRAYFRADDYASRNIAPWIRADYLSNPDAPAD